MELYGYNAYAPCMDAALKMATLILLACTITKHNNNYVRYTPCEACTIW